MKEIRKEEVLSLSNGGLDIFQAVLNRMGSQINLKTGSNPSLRNPFYPDKNPSLSIYSKEGIYYFKDFGDETYKGDAFDFFALYAKLDPKSDFPEILKTIWTDVLGLSIDEFHQSGINKFEKVELNKWKYWIELFPKKPNIIEKAKIFGLNWLETLSTGGKVFKWRDADPLYGFAMGEAVKMYRPLNKDGEKHRWFNYEALCYQHFLDLIKPGKPCLITEGYKDAFSAFLHGFNVFPLDSASHSLPHDVLSWFEKNNIPLIVCLDNDKAGTKKMNEVSEKLNIPKILLPKNLENVDIKDITDLLVHGSGKAWLEQQIISCNPGHFSGNKYVHKIINDRKGIFERAGREIVWTKPIICLKENGIIYKNTINTIIGAAGTHKSRMCECIAAAALSSTPQNRSVFSLAEGQQSTAVLYVDTERNHIDQLPYAVQQIRRLASGNAFDESLEFDAISLVSIERSKRFEALGAYIGDKIRETNKHLLIIVDVVTDCVTDFNRVDDSLGINDFMNEMINEQNVTFLVVIHANPSSTKARGHLGTELVNKSSYVGALSLLDDGIIELSTSKLRVKQKPQPTYFKYDEELKHLSSIDHKPEIVSSQKGPKKAPVQNILPMLSTYPTNVDISSVELNQRVIKVFECSERTAEERIRQIINDEMVFDNNGQPHILVRQKKGFVKILPHQAQTQIPL